jgi:hypothetical protein
MQRALSVCACVGCVHDSVLVAFLLLLLWLRPELPTLFTCTPVKIDLLA